MVSGCGGGDEAQGPHSATGGSAPRPAVAGSTSFQPGPPAGSGGFGGGGGGGFGGGSLGGSGGFSGGGSSHSAHPRLGGIAGVLHDREARRRAAIERAHRPPGPVRLGSLDEQAQRGADWGASSAAAHPITSTDDDQCERLWAQHVASSEAYHATRHDGLHSATSARDQRHFLATCRAQPPAMQQCMDRAYLEQHQDECTQARAQDPTRREAARVRAAAREPVQF